MPRASPSSTRAACISVLVLIALIAGAWLAAISSGRGAVPARRSDFRSEPLIVPGPVAPPSGAAQHSRLALP